MIITLYIIAGIIAIILLLALIMKKDYNTYSEITVQAPLQKAYDYIKHIKNQDHYNKWVMMDPNMKKNFAEQTALSDSYMHGMQIRKAVKANRKITALEEGKNIKMEIRFVRPIAGIAHAEMSTKAISADQTKVMWRTSSKMKYPLNFMLPVIVKMMEKDMRTSLNTLQQILEK